MSQAVNRAASGMKSAGSTLTAGLTAPIVGGAAAFALIGAGAEHAFTQVRKTVDLGEQDLKDFHDALLALSTSEAGGGKSFEDLSAVAAIAGQLGIEGKDNLLEFTRVSAQMSVATGIAADKIGEDMAVIIKLSGTAADKFENVGSAIVDLGNKMGGTESDILGNARRIVGTLATAGVSIQDTLGIASAMAELQIPEEAGGTAVSKTFRDMQNALLDSAGPTEEQQKKIIGLQDRIADLSSSLEVATDRQKTFGRNTSPAQVTANTEAIAKYKRELGQAQEELTKVSAASQTGSAAKFAEVIGVTTDEFKDLIKNDPAQAFVLFTKGLKRLADTGGPEAQLQALQDLGITETRQIDALQKLANGGESLDKGMRLANEAFAENTALGEESSKNMQDTINQFELLKNQLKALVIEGWEPFKAIIKEVFADIRANVIPKLAELKDNFLKLDPETRKTALSFLGVAAAVGPVLFALGLFVAALGILLNPIVLVAGLVGFLAAMWITNFGNIRQSAGDAILKVKALLDGDFSGALRAAAVIAVVAAAIIGNAIGGLVVKFAGLATAWLLNAGKMAVGWLIAAGPAALLILAIAGVITAVDLLRHAWDSNWNGMQEKVAPILEIIAAIDRAIASFPGFTDKTRAAFQAEADSLQALADQAKNGTAVSPPAPLLDLGENFVKQFQDGFPAIQKTIRDNFNQGLIDNAPLLAQGGITPDTLNSLGLNPAGGQMPTISDGLTRAGAFTSAPTVNVAINNPAVFDASMLAQMNDQIAQSVTQMLILSEQMADAPPQQRLPGQPLFGPSQPPAGGG